MEPKLRFKEFSGNLNNKLVSEIAEIFLGLTYTPKYVEDGVMFLSSKDISKDYLDLSDVKFISREEYNKSTSNAKPKKGDILFVRVGSNLGHPVILDIEDEICIFVSLGFLRVKKEFCNSYVKQWMLSNYFWKQVDSKVAGGAKNNLNTGWLKKFKLNIPSLSEQTKIADFLSTVDEKIQNQQDKITHLENIKKGFMQKIFSRKIRFKDANGNEFPEWEEKKIEDIVISLSIKPFQIKSKEYLDYGKIPVIDQGKLKYVGYTNNEDKKFTDLPIIIYGDHTTFVKYSEVPFVVGADGVKLLKCNKENCKYIYYAIKKYNIIPEGYKRHFSIVKKINIPIPCLKEQQKIADFLSSFDEKVDAEKETLEHLKELKKGLLQQMFV